MKMNPWAFGIIFLSGAIYLMANDFELPKLDLFYETETVEGVVYKKRSSRARLPYGGMAQNNFYTYKVNNTNYIAVFRTNNNDSKPSIGDSLLIKYRLSNPEKSEVISNYYNVIPKRSLLKRKTKYKTFYLSNTKQIIFKENIFLFESDGGKREENFKISGTYIKDENRLQLTPLVFHKYNKGKYKNEELLAYNSDTIQLKELQINKNGTLSEIK